MQIKVFREKDTLVMKKNHACSKSAFEFTVLRVGSDVRIVCDTCKRDVTVPRIKLEKSIRKIVSHTDDNTQNPNGVI